MLIDLKISMNFTHGLGSYILMPGRLEMSSVALLGFILMCIVLFFLRF